MGVQLKLRVSLSHLRFITESAFYSPIYPLHPYPQTIRYPYQRFIIMLSLPDCLEEEMIT